MAKVLSRLQKKTLYSNLATRVSDEVILCFIFPLMKEKKLPNIDSRVYHHMVLNSIKYQNKMTLDFCMMDARIIINAKFPVCKLCNRQSLSHGTFCVNYLRYHEHIHLCINCSSKIERRTSRIIELVGVKEYYIILRKMVFINRLLPKDLSDIIMFNLINLFRLYV